MPVAEDVDSDGFLRGLGARLARYEGEEVGRRDGHGCLSQDPQMNDG